LYVLLSGFPVDPPVVASLKEGPDLLRVQLVGDIDPAVTLEFEGCFAAGDPIVTGATGHREYHVLGFETTDALSIDFGPFVLLDEGGVR